jgi:ketosteroid isomerase-like protein
VPEGRHELMSRGYAALNEGDFARVAEIVGPHVRFYASDNAPEDEWIGQDGLVQLLENWSKRFERLHYECERIEDSGDHSVALVRLVAKPKGGAGETRTRIAHLWRFRAEVPVLLRVYLHPDRALKAIGSDD